MPDGIARQTSRFDDRSQQIEHAFFGPHGMPTTSPDGYARATHSYDEHGNRTETALFGIDGKPTRGRDGFARMRFHYDETSDLVGRTFFDSDGRELLAQVVIVEVLPRSQAERLGLRPGDRIVVYDGAPITSAAGLLRGVRAPGEGTREIEVLRDGSRLRVTVAPGLMGVRMEERPALVDR